MTASAAIPTQTGDLRLGAFRTVGGQLLPDARLRYRVLGDPALGAERGWNLVFHALTGSHEVDSWWAPLLAPGAALDPAYRPLVAANLLGSCYGSTGPSPASWTHSTPFPDLTTTDLALAHAPLLTHLGVTRLALATGGSLGGMVALEWARLATVPTDRVVVLAAPAFSSAQSIGWNAAQRMAIEADPAWRGGRYAEGQAPRAGLAAARAIAMITYRSALEFGQRFGRRTDRGGKYAFDVEGYLRYQGDKLVDRFDAASYVHLTRIMDSHDVGSIELAARATAERVGQLVGVGIDTDILYAATEIRDWVAAYQAAGGPATYREITTAYGHDAFLIEWDQLAAILRDPERR
ncbi:MAG: homoserine O-acetyltransferase [Gemmatimonadota bacterium]